MRDELLKQLDKDFENKNLTKEQYEYFKNEIESKADQQAKLLEDRKTNKIDEETFYNWSESIAGDYRVINEKWRETVEKNVLKRQKDAEKKFRRPFVIGFFLILGIVGTWHTISYFYRNRSIQDVPEPTQVMLSAEEENEVHHVEAKDLGLGDYRMDMNYMASYDIQGIVLDTKHFDGEDTPFDKAFPVDVSIAWGELAANRDIISCTNGPRKLGCTYDTETVVKRTKAGRGIIDLVSNNHLSPANREIRDKIMRIRAGNYIRLQGYLIHVWISDDNHEPVEALSSLSRQDHMSSIFDTTNTGCEVMYVTSVEWLD